MHQVAYLRNSIAHPPKPSLAEAVAGVAAMVEVLKDHGQPIQDMLRLLDTLREASWRGGGELLDCACVLCDEMLLQVTRWRLHWVP